MFRLEIVAFVGILSLHDWGSCEHTWLSHKRKLQQQRDEDYNNVLRNDYLPPLTQTEYKYRSVQTGSVDVPYNGGNSIYVGPDHNQTKSYLAKIDTTILSPRRYSFSKAVAKQSIKKTCVKCPFDRTVIAQKRLDGVLIEPPLALSCITNQPFSRSIYDVQTLFGPKLFFVLPQGTHYLIAKVVNKKTGREDLKCTLKYKVIVRKCQKYQLINTKDLQVKCDLDNIWGSKCTFSCKHGGDLSHESPIICGDDLSWSGDEPVCSLRYENHEKLSCDLPVPPTNGKFSCEVNTIETYEAEPRTPSGSICRVSCDKQYFVPEYLQDYSTFYCNDGKWNSTMLNFCQRGLRKF